MRNYIRKWSSISSNTLFGIFKSVFAYIFIIGLYKYVSVPDAVKNYIDYEVWAAASVLFAFGLQGHAYKTLKSELIAVLSLALAAVATLLFVFYVLYKDQTSLLLVVLVLVILDRCLDIALQAERQLNRFNVYNWNDIINSILVKAGFFVYAVGYDIWFFVLAIKITVCYYFVFRQVTIEIFNNGVREIGDYFRNWRRFLEWYAFDFLNFSVMNLDLVLIRFLAPAYLVELYFYVRKFVRLPLVLLNYVVDPLYVSIRGIDVKERAVSKLIEFLVPIYCGAVLSLLAIGGFLFFHFDSVGESVFGFCVAITSFVLVVVRFGDLYVLLFCSQRHRLALRVLCLIGVVVIPVGLLFNDGFLFTILIFPLVGWVVALRLVFNVHLIHSLLQFAYVGSVMVVLYSSLYLKITRFTAGVIVVFFGVLACVMGYAALKQFLAACRYEMRSLGN